MANELGIVITGQLDFNKTKEQINAELQTLARQLDKLNIDVKIDGSLKDLQNELKAISNVASKDIKLDVGDLGSKSSVKNLQDFKKYLDDIGATLIRVQKQEVFTGQEQQIASLVATYQEADGIIKELTFTPSQLDEGQLIPHFQKTREEVAKLAKEEEKLHKQNQKYLRDDINIQDQKNKGLEDTARKHDELVLKLKELYRQGKITGEQLQQDIGSLETDPTEANLQAIEEQLKRISAYSQGTILGGGDQFKNLDMNSREHLRNILQTNQAYKDMNIETLRLDTQTGKWAATLRDTNNQQVSLSGVIDRTNGEIRQQKSVISDVKEESVSMAEQLKIALQRVPIWINLIVQNKPL